MKGNIRKFNLCFIAPYIFPKFPFDKNIDLYRSENLNLRLFHQFSQDLVLVILAGHLPHFPTIPEIFAILMLVGRNTPSIQVEP